MDKGPVVPLAVAVMGWRDIAPETRVSDTEIMGFGKLPTWSSIFEISIK